VAYCSQIKVAKDVAAGAVLLGSIAAALIGFLTFLPYITAFGGTENKVAASNTSLAALSATDSDYSRFLVFHCLNPQQNERSTSDRVASAASGKPGV